VEGRVLKRRKKNLRTYLQVSEDIGWSPSTCITCEGETAEFINGKPPCRSDKCKHFGNISNAENAPRGDLRQYLVGIEEVLEVAGMVISLSPLDGEGYPTAPVSEIMALPFEVSFEARDFFELISLYMSDLKNNIAQKRKWEAQKNKRV